MGDRLTTAAAAAMLDVNITRVQQLCRLYFSSEKRQGLPCEREGNGRHATYYIQRMDVEVWRMKVIPANGPRGRGRPKKSANTKE